MAENFTTYYSLKNYQVSQYFIKASLNPQFTIDNSTIINKFNDELKDFLKGIINSVGSKGVKYNITAIFGQQYEQFWAQSLQTMTLTLKDGYYQITSNFNFTNHSLFEDITLGIFKSINNSDVCELMANYSFQLQPYLNESLTQLLDQRNIVINPRLSDKFHSPKPSDLIPSQLRNDFKSLASFFSNEASPSQSRRRRRIKEIQLF